MSTIDPNKNKQANERKNKKTKNKKQQNSQIKLLTTTSGSSGVLLGSPSPSSGDFTGSASCSSVDLIGSPSGSSVDLIGSSSGDFTCPSFGSSGGSIGSPWETLSGSGLASGALSDGARKVNNMTERIQWLQI